MKMKALKARKLLLKPHPKFEKILRNKITLPWVLFLAMIYPESPPRMILMMNHGPIRSVKEKEWVKKQKSPH